jgi:hypothetical protein
MTSRILVTGGTGTLGGTSSGACGTPAATYVYSA